MACKIEIKQNLENEVTQKADGLETMQWKVALQKARSINAAYKFNVVSVHEGENEYVNKVTVTIPPELVDKYHAHFTKLEQQEARGVQQEDAQRTGEEYNDRYLFQLSGMPASKASPQTVARVKKAAAQMGIIVQDIVEYVKNNPAVDTKSANGVADLIQGVVAISNELEDAALTEETVHIATAILEQTNPKLITEMISRIDQFKIYKKVLENYRNNPHYQLNGKPNIRKIKKEAVDKLIAEVIVHQNEGTTEFPELMEEVNKSMIQKWWEAIKEAIRRVYSKTTVDLLAPYKKAADVILSGETGGTVSDIKEGGIFLQANDAVDKLYNKVIDIDSRMELFPETPTDKRHYKFDGGRVAKTVTEKIKEPITMPERTPNQKISDDQKKEWGNVTHAFLRDYISVNLIDKDGYARKDFLDIPITTKLNSTIQDKLQNFAKELVRSYREGTRFAVERMVLNEKESGLLGSAIDFMAIEPDPVTGVKVDIFDWKATSIDKTQDDDIPWFKRKEWKPQMGEYVKIMYNYGVKQNQMRKTRMIPIIQNYEYAVPGKASSGLTPRSIEIGNINSLNETKLYLLPVALLTESTGTKEVDQLIKSLDTFYEKLYKQPVSPENRALKLIQLNQLSKAIRQLHMRLDFAPLFSVGRTFLLRADATLKSFQNINYDTITKDELKAKLKDLLEFKNSAEKFANIDRTYLAQYPKEDLDEEGKKTLAKMEKLSSSTASMLNKILKIQQEYVVQLALQEGITTPETKEEILAPEKEVEGMLKILSEASRLPIKAVKLVTNMILNARSLVNMEMNDKMEDFKNILLPLEKLASRTGKSAFSYIGVAANGKLRLIKKIDKAFWKELKDKKDAGDLQFLKDNLDLEKYKLLADDAIKKGIDILNHTEFSSNMEDDINRREYEIERLKDRLDIDRKNFNGFKHPHFGYLYNRAMKVDQHLSAEYKEMARIPEALAVWEFFTKLNERAKSVGYLDEQGISFFPLIEASMLQKLSMADNIISESGDIFEDFYKVRVNEQHEYSKIDEETNLPKKEIPKLFTITDKQEHQLSRDLTKVGTLWIKTLMEYESAREMETTLQTILAVERAKGHLIVDQNKELIEENGTLKVDTRSNKNADIIETIIDDAIYGIHENLASIGNMSIEKGIQMVSKDKSKESVSSKALSTRKLMQNMNMLTQALGVGLKYTIAIPNYFGVHFQSFINNGGLYTYGEYFKNHVKLLTHVGLTTIDKGLVDMFVPLNGTPYEEKRREIAYEQGYVKWLGAWTMQEFMMSTNYLPERNLQYTNAMSFIDNAMIRDGKIVNIRQWLKAQERSRYKTMDQAERRRFEKGFDARVEALKNKESLPKIAKIEGDKVVIPGVSKEELAKFRTKMVEWGRNLNGQMSMENRADYRRDTLLKSMAMFRNWIPKQVAVRAHDISRNVEIGQWEYGRTRAFFKTWQHLGFLKIHKMEAIIHGTDEGLKILDEMLEQKKEDYLRKTGNELTITQEEFYDMMRQVLANEVKELGMLISLAVIVFAARSAAPPEDEDRLTKNKFRFFIKLLNKISNEVDFYYDPISFITITKGNFLPALGMLAKVKKAMVAVGNETYGRITDNQELIDESYPLKYFLDVFPITSQFEREWLPLIAPELARDMGIIVSSQPRPQQ